jgi:peptidoglycan-associated lipoprotein
VMSFNTKRAVQLALIFTATAVLSACASKPKPQPQQPQPPMEQPRPQPRPQPQPPQPPGIVPGSEQDFVINIGDRVYFDFDSYAIRPDAQPVLAAQAAWLNRYPSVRVRVEGNCDERGTREYNLALGARRANAIRDFLVSRGVSTARIATLSYGKERPIDGGTGEDAWARNRNGHTAIVDGAR